MSERIGWEVLQLTGRQKDHVGEVSEGFETSCPDDSRLDLAVDVLGHRIAGSESVGGQNAGQMGFECLAQALEGLKATASCPGDESAKQGFGLGTGSTLGVNLLVTLLHAPGAGGLQSRALEPVHVGDLLEGPVLG